MFKSSKKSYQGTDTLIGQGTEIDGKIKCSTNLRIEGKVQGDIECNHDVIIGETSVCHSNIAANEIVIAGKVYGDLTIKDMLTIMPSGQLHGNFSSQSVVIHEGGIFNGTSSMNRPDPSAKKNHDKNVDNKEKSPK